MTTPGYVWKLRPLMAERQLWKTSELAPLLAEQGVILSSAQVFRLVANAPERLSLRILVALCRIFDCTPNDLVEITDVEEVAPARPRTGKTRPRRAEVVR